MSFPFFFVTIVKGVILLAIFVDCIRIQTITTLKEPPSRHICLSAQQIWHGLDTKVEHVNQQAHTTHKNTGKATIFWCSSFYLKAPDKQKSIHSGMLFKREKTVASRLRFLFFSVLLFDHRNWTHTKMCRAEKFEFFLYISSSWPLRTDDRIHTNVHCGFIDKNVFIESCRTNTHTHPQNQMHTIKISNSIVPLLTDKIPSFNCTHTFYLTNNTFHNRLYSDWAPFVRFYPHTTYVSFTSISRFFFVFPAFLFLSLSRLGPHTHILYCSRFNIVAIHFLQHTETMFDSVVIASPVENRT